MSTRRLRKQLQPEFHEDDEEIEDQPINKVNAFALLNDDEEEEVHEDEHEQQEEEEEIVEQKLAKKKKKKKSKRKVDHDDKVFAEFMAKNKDLEEEEEKEFGKEKSDFIRNLAELLETRNVFFNVKKELLRIFGSSAIKTMKEAADSEAKRPPNQRLKFYSKKTFLVQADPAWPLFPLSEVKDIQFLKKDDQSAVFTVVYSEDYQKIQKEYVACVETFDPQAIAFMVSKYPYHIDSLLQMAEIYRQHGEMKVAADLVERAIYRIECSFPGHIDFRKGNFRIDFESAKAFYISFYRHIQNLGRQGCSRTALEFCKLLLSFAPESDPLCILFMIDHFALRAKEYSYLIDFTRIFCTDSISEVCAASHYLGNIQLLPSFSYSVALAKYYLDSDSKEQSPSISSDILSNLGDFSNPNLKSSNELLAQAIALYPEMLEPLIKKCSDKEFSNPVWSEIFTTNSIFFESAKELKSSPLQQKMLKLFVERNHVLWNSESVLAWIRNLVISIVNEPVFMEKSMELQEKKRVLFGASSKLSTQYGKINLSELLDNVNALPVDQLGDQFRQVRVQQPRPEEHGVALNLNDNPIRAFLLSLLPWVNVPEEQQQ